MALDIFRPLSNVLQLMQAVLDSFGSHITYWPEGSCVALQFDTITVGVKSCVVLRVDHVQFVSEYVLLPVYLCG